jgi:hypothetical protein
MSYRKLVFVVTLLAVLALAVRPSVDSDTWWHLRAGAWMVDHRQILTADPFSLTRQGQPWIYPGWLAQLALYGVYAALSYGGLNLVTGLMVALAFVSLWPVLDAGPLVRAFVLILAASASGIFWSARPQIFTLALAGVFIALLERQRANRGRGWWILPLLMVGWVNLHGGFAVGLMLIGVYGLGEGAELVLARRRGLTWAQAWTEHRPRLLRWGAAGALSVAALALNPAGPVMVLYPFKTLSIGVLRQYIQEWQSPDFHLLQTQPFAWMLILTLVVLAVSKLRPHAAHLLLVALFAWWGLDAARNIGLFAVASAPALARHADDVVRELRPKLAATGQIPERLARALNLGLGLLVALAALARIATQLPDSVNQSAVEATMPVEAVDFLEARPPVGPLFNSYNWGGYILWRLYPGYLSFVDGRTDLFDDQLLTQYLSVWSGDAEWKPVFQEWGIRLVLIEPEAPLAQVLEANGWRIVYQDAKAVILMPGGA